jgi:ribose transport system substrate-binding protein
MKKFLALILSAAMVVSISACGSQSNSSDSTAAGSAVQSSGSTNFATGRTIGKNSFLAGSYAHDIMTKTAKVITDGNGDKIKEFTDQGNILNLLTDVENMINSKVDGALWWGVLDSNYAVGPQKFENAKIPFAFFDCVPSDKQIVSDIENMKYFAGGASTNNTMLGEQMGKKAVEDGCKKAIVFANEIGSPVADRATAFKKVFEAAGGKVVEISHAATTANAHVEAATNMLATYPDVDCIYGVGIDLALGASSVASKLPSRKIKIYATDISPDALKYLKNGSISGLNGAHWAEVYFATALLLNAMDGHKITDANGKAPMFVVNPLVVTPKSVDLYEKFWIKEMPYSYKDLNNLLFRNNSKVTYDDFKKAIEDYTLENVLNNKLKEGKVTADEIKAAGLNVQ